ncbi:MAG: DUF2958 domain-containing protein [Rhodopirellula sp.]|nr:DUF2958 domain-containing protein [Rhodopirellula sp.]
MVSRNPAYQYIPAEIAAIIPPLYSTENDADPVAHIKLFTPDSSWTWYIARYDPEQRLCFGLVVGHEREPGYFSLKELEGIRGQLGLPVERDLFWTPRPLSRCQ